jgi:hypothetical protein
MARIDPIDSAEDALALMSIAVAQPHVAETIAVLLDDARHGSTIVNAPGTVDPDAMFEVLEHCMLSPDVEDFAAIVLVTVRPCGSIDADDVDRWMDASECCALLGLELVEWFVMCGDVVVCPRDLLGEPPRWGRTV